MGEPLVTTEQGRVLPVSLIIPSRNRPHLLMETVVSVLGGNALPAELLIIDQSDTCHAELSTYPSQRAGAIRYVWQQERGSSCARNAGIALARYDTLVFIDDDMLVAPDWLDALVGALARSTPRSVVTGQVQSADPDVPGAVAPSLNTSEEPEVYEGHRGEGRLSTGNMAMHRSLIAEIGDFDERLGAGATYPSSEDNDLAFRLLAAGYRIVYVPEAIVYHRAWRAGRDFYRLRWSYSLGQGAYYGKHMQLGDRYMLGRLAWIWKDHVVTSVRALGYNRQKAIGNALYSLGLVIGAVRWLVVERLFGEAKVKWWRSVRPGEGGYRHGECSRCPASDDE